MILLCSIAAGCGGGNELPAAGPSQQAAQPLPEAPANARQVKLAVRMNPQQEISEQPGGLKAASAISMQLSSMPLPGRSTSASEVEVAAVDYRTDLLNSRVEVKGDYLVYRPVWNNAIFDDLSDAAYAIYQVDLTGYTGDPTIGFNWAENGLPRIPDKYFVGLANWDANRWSWFDGPLDQVLTLDDLAPYTDANGKLLLNVLALQRESVVVLRNMTIGAPEMRGTGFEYEDIPVQTSAPALYVPTLPGSVDLRAGCAPINDQGYWGSCTAFAVGDGAYNYELYSIYESLGWDLTGTAFRVSPKFLYIESGKDQGFPPGGDYGRWTDVVADGLTRFGIATELNAPYDYDYNDNWSIAALNDAAVLKSTGYVPLASHSTAAIEGIKSVLAFQQRPVLVSTQVDYGLITYAPGQVWHFQGPSFGGHAMLIVGYDNGKEAFLVRNSWGTDWGEDGYLWMAYDTLTHPYNWYVQCGYITDEYNEATAQRFTGNSISLLPPDNLEASQGTAGSSIALSWTPVDGADGYRIYRDTRQNLVQQVGAVSEYTDNSVLDELAHSYWVTALKDSSESAHSAPDLGYVAQSPQVSGVSPTSGAEGQTIRFIPQVSGDPQATFSWDFGGGASPNTSSDPGPVVVLGSEGSYDASLTVIGAEGNQKFDFTLEVKLNQPPAAYLFDPNNGKAIAPYECTLDATSGDSDGWIVLYEFDWENDGIYDLVTTEPVVQHTYTELGTVTAKVRVMDDAGLYDTATEQITIEPDNFAPYPTITATPPSGPAPLDVEFDSAGSYDQDGFLIYYEWDFENDGTIDAEGDSLTTTDHVYPADGTYTAMLRVTDNEGATGEITTEVAVGLPLIGGWTSHAIRTWTDGTNSRRINATLVGGNPAVSVTTNNTGMEYVSSGVAVPDDSSDWSVMTALANGSLPNSTKPYGLCNLSGVPLVSYSGGSLSSIKWTGASWLDMNVDGTANCGESSSIAIVAGKPAIAYTYPSNPNSIYYAYSTESDPALAGDWVVTELETDGNPVVSDTLQLIEIGGMPYVAYGKNGEAPNTQKRLWLARGLTATPTGTADWARHEVDPAKNTGLYMSITELGGRPAIAYGFADGPLGMRFAWADSASPASTDDWNIMAVETGKRGIPSLAVVGGVPMFSYVANSPNGGLTLAKASSSTPAGDGDWSFERLIPQDIGGGQSPLLEVNGLPAIIYGWNAAANVVFITPAP
ncbi:MAG: PKD domain-containing protein [Planctomycetales bacterium]|nr:PKD domain-containing protein [bacterium]UNM06997.1 MAG: PKD domain-containing protein [Planctomycetales bacterium]